MRIVIILFWVFCSLACKTSNDKVEPLLASVDTEIAKEKITIAHVMGKFDPASDEDFLLIDTIHADRPGLYLHKDTYEAFKKMYSAAKADGIQLVIRSATRNFDYQKGIWERKWKANSEIVDPKTRALKILEYSSMPGSSRHHWGTDIDLNSFENEWFESGEGLKLYNWMLDNAANFGFCQPYTQKDEHRPDGYYEEKWHWTYMPRSIALTDFATKHLKDSMITGFLGAETATDIQIVKKYIAGINHNCK